MGRHHKTVFTSEGLERRELGYYSTPDFVAKFLSQVCLELLPGGKDVFDPCIGKGELVLPFIQQGLFVEGIDIIPHTLPESIKFSERNFIDYYHELSSKNFFNIQHYLPHDYIVANPPYNCHEVTYIRENKDWLKQLFQECGTLNLYAMFLHALIELAKEGAVIGVIVQDSFLTSSGYISLREKILSSCAIHYVILAPTDLFLSQGADVRTCIMVLQKGKKHQKQIKVANRVKTSNEFEDMLNNRHFQNVSISQLMLNSANDNKEFVIGAPSQIKELFDRPRVGQIFPCITGISTGNDKLFLRKEREEGYTVPFYKNPGLRKFYTEPDCYLIDTYLEEDKRTSNFMVRNKHLMSKGGIVCSSMGVPFSAALFPEKSTFGVNPCIIVDETDCWWLMSYLNSSLATYLVRGIIARTNMITSGYASRIPIPELPKEIKKKLSRISQEACRIQVKPSTVQPFIAEIDEILSQVLLFNSKTVKHLEQFCAHLLKLS